MLQSLHVDAILKSSERGRFVRYNARTNESIIRGKTMDTCSANEDAAIPDGWALVTLPPGFEGMRRIVDLRSSPNMLIISHDLPMARAILQQYALSAQVGGHEIWLLNGRSDEKLTLQGIDPTRTASMGDLDGTEFALAQLYREASRRSELLDSSVLQKWDEIFPALSPIMVIIENTFAICSDADLGAILGWLAARGAAVGIHFAMSLPLLRNNAEELVARASLARFTTKVKVVNTSAAPPSTSEMVLLFGRRSRQAAIVASNALQTDNHLGLAIYSTAGGPIAAIKLASSESVWRTCRADLKARILHSSAKHERFRKGTDKRRC